MSAVRGRHAGRFNRPGVSALRAKAQVQGVVRNGKANVVLAATVRTGDIGERIHSIGAVESSNSVVFTIAQNYCQEVIRKFDAHQTLAVEASNSQEEKFGHGFLSAVDTAIDTSTGTLKCKATLIPEGENLMVPGFFLNISMLLGMKHGVTLAPTGGIQRDPQSAFVWVIQADQTVRRRTVRVGTIDGDLTEIRSGLSPGELVASSGFDLLSEGQKIHHYFLGEKGSAPISYQWHLHPINAPAATNGAQK